MTHGRKAILAAAAALVASSLAFGGGPARAQQTDNQSCAETLTQQLRRYSDKCLSEVVTFVSSHPKMAAKIYGEQTSDKGPFDFLMVIGDGREDEKVFRWANNLHAESAVKDVVTVSLGNRNTEASATLTQGVSGKFESSSRIAMQFADILRCARYVAEIGQPFLNLEMTGHIGVTGSWLRLKT